MSGSSVIARVPQKRENVSVKRLYVLLWISLSNRLKELIDRLYNGFVTAPGTNSRALYQDMFSQNASYHLKFNAPFVSEGIAAVDLG